MAVFFCVGFVTQYSRMRRERQYFFCVATWGMWYFSHVNTIARSDWVIVPRTMRGEKA
jgi:hypothetical protein